MDKPADRARIMEDPPVWCGDGIHLPQWLHWRDVDQFLKKGKERKMGVIVQCITVIQYNDCTILVNNVQYYYF